jgi:hypothetical protein
MGDKILAGSDIHPVGTVIRSRRGNLRVVKMIPHYGYIEYEVEPINGSRWKKMKLEFKRTLSGIFSR